jgi:hypothetical protein
MQGREYNKAAAVLTHRFHQQQAKVQATLLIAVQAIQSLAALENRGKHRIFR